MQTNILYVMHWQASGATLKPCQVSRLSNYPRVVLVRCNSSQSFCIITFTITVLMSRRGNQGKFNGLLMYTTEAQSVAPAPAGPSYSLPQPRGAAPRMLHAHVLILPVHALAMPSL